MTKHIAIAEMIQPGIPQRIAARTGMDSDLLICILDLFSKNLPKGISTTPKLIAAALGIDENFVLSDRWKYYFERYLIFQTNDGKPTADTPILLTAEGWRCMPTANLSQGKIA